MVYGEAVSLQIYTNCSGKMAQKTPYIVCFKGKKLLLWLFKPTYQ
jgi:hypothetical protein